MLHSCCPGDNDVPSLWLGPEPAKCSHVADTSAPVRRRMLVRMNQEGLRNAHDRRVRHGGHIHRQTPTPHRSRGDPHCPPGGFRHPDVPPEHRRPPPPTSPRPPCRPPPPRPP